MNYLAVTWTDFMPATGTDGFVQSITGEFSTVNLIAVLAGIVGITTAFTLIWRLAAYIRRQILGAMTNSRRRR